MFKYTIDDDIELRLVQNNQGEEILNLIEENREHLRKWLPWVDNIKGVNDVIGFIESSKKQYVNNNGFQASIWYKGKIAGMIGFHSINYIHKTTSNGYWLAKEYVGNGVMTKSCNTLIEYAFKELKLNRIEIRCAEKNIRSRAIPERLGFKKEGVLKEVEWLYDHYVNHIVYSVLRKEWVNQ